jgi:NAD(P)H dehydrogenase (quinone)
VVKYLIVYAHPNPKSFNHAILERCEAALKDAGRNYEVRDLYALKFDPALDRKDLDLLGEGKVVKKVEDEQRLIREADVLIFIYPIWWFGMPAILKGYIDRVFTEGFAFSMDGERLAGLLQGKRVIIMNTTGASRDVLLRTGYEEAMRKMEDIGIFDFCGMRVFAHKYFYGVENVDEAARKKMLEEVPDIVSAAKTAP